MKTAFLFVRSAVRHWRGWITGSAATALLFVGERVFQKQVPSWTFYLFAVGGLLVSAFRAWRDEYERANAATTEITRIEAARAAAKSAARETSDEMYWLLTKAQRWGLRRQSHIAIDGSTSYSIWINDRPVYYLSCGWLYSLVDEAEKTGFLKQRLVPGSGPVYELTEEARLVLEAGVRTQRVVGIAHGPLTDARTGQPFTL
jgi:hypothetical protein